jgi:N-acetylglucosaminyldiphosphoundecaprenol N-acetyl-beta-D-mannosaminyltransferase
VNTRINVLGIDVSAIDLGVAAQTIADWIEHDRREYVCVTGVHGVIESQRDPVLKEIHNAAGMVTPDGMPLVWCGMVAGARGMTRVYGPDLMLKVCGESEATELRHFFYGAAEGVADELASNMREWFPNLDVVGTHSPPFRDLTDEEVHQTVHMINLARPDIVWVGLSTPKQERWMSQFRGMLDAPVLIGVGAAFDIHAGRVSQAPHWMQRSGLEWLFRLSVEPKRLWRRYLSVIPAFMFQIVMRPPRLVAKPGGPID